MMVAGHVFLHCTKNKVWTATRKQLLMKPQRCVWSLLLTNMLVCKLKLKMCCTSDHYLINRTAINN